MRTTQCRGPPTFLQESGQYDNNKRRKGTRIVWTPELEQKFLDVVKTLGPDATPAKILKGMDVRGITRLQVASHFQKYKSVFKEKTAKIKIDQPPPKNIPLNAVVKKENDSANITQIVPQIINTNVNILPKQECVVHDNFDFKTPLPPITVPTIRPKLSLVDASLMKSWRVKEMDSSVISSTCGEMSGHSYPPLSGFCS